MKITTKLLYKYIFIFTLLYVYTKALWDTYLGAFGKYIFYGAVIIGIFMYALSSISNRRRKDLIVLCGFTIYAIYIFLNGKALSNSAQFSQGMLEYILYTFYFLSCSYYARKGEINENDLIKFVYLGAFLSLLAVYEYVTRSGLVPDSAYGVYYFAGGFSSFRARVFCVSPMSFCMMLGILFVFSFYMIIVNKYKNLIIPSVLILVGMFCTGSRGPLVGTVCGIIVMICLIWCRNPLTRKKAERTLLLFLISLPLLLVLYVLVSSGINTGIEQIDNVIKRFSTITDFTYEWGNVARLRIWSKYIEMFINNFWTGIGISQTSSTVATNILQVTESGILKRLVETGILGTLIYLGFICYPVIKYSVKKNNQRTQSDFKMVIISLIVAIGVEEVVLQLFADVMNMYVFWTFIAIMYCQNQKQKDSLTVEEG